MNDDFYDLSLALTPAQDGAPSPYLRTAVVVSTGTTWTIALDGVNTPATVLAGVVAAVNDTVTVLTQVGAPPLVLGPIDGAAQEWSTFVPVVTQGVTVTKNVEFSEYRQQGDQVTWQFDLSITSGGTAGTALQLSTPLPIASTRPIVMGIALIFDAAPMRYVCTIERTGTSLVHFGADGQANANPWGVAPNLAIANGDAIRGTMTWKPA